MTIQQIAYDEYIGGSPNAPALAGQIKLITIEDIELSIDVESKTIDAVVSSTTYAARFHTSAEVRRRLAQAAKCGILDLTQNNLFNPLPAP